MSFRRKSSKNSVQNSELCSLSPTGSISPPSLSSPPPPSPSLSLPHPLKSKKQNRKHKSKSLIVPPTTALFSSDNLDCGGSGGGTSDSNGKVRSADADSPLLELRRRFSFRNFRRCRSVSKSRTNDSTPQSPTNETSTTKHSIGMVGDGSGRPTITVASDTDCSDRCDTPTSVSPPLPPSAVALSKFHSFVDICLFFTKLQRQLTLTLPPKITSRAHTAHGTPGTNIHPNTLNTSKQTDYPPPPPVKKKSVGQKIQWIVLDFASYR